MTPRELLSPGLESAFGRAEEPPWREPANPDERVLLAAAQLQHSESLALRRRLKDLRLSVKDFAAHCHVNAEGLRRKLRGETWASLRDVALWRVGLDEQT